MSLKAEGGRKKEEMQVVQDARMPEGWVATTLNDVLVNVIGGGTPSRNIPAYFDGSIPWFTVKDMKSLKPRDAKEHITEDAIENSATNLIPANTLVIATRIALGRAMRPTVDCAINQDLKALILGSGIEPNFLLYWVCAHERAIQDLGSGTTVSGIRLETLRSLSVLLPPAAEQTRIVKKLEELLSDLDAGVAELKAAQKKLAQYRQSLLKAAVEGQLTADWRAQHPPTETGAELLARILQERRTRWEAKQLEKFASQGKTPPKNWQGKYPEPIPPDTQNLPTLPEGWVWASVDQLATLLSGHTPKDAGTKTTPLGDIHWFKVGDMNQDGNEEFLKSAQARFDGHIVSQLGLKIAPAGTIVFPKRGGAISTNKKRRLGIAASYDLNMMGMIPDEVIADWFWWWFCMIDLGQLCDGSNVPQINNPDIAPLAVPIPPTAEQRQIMKRLVAQFAAVKDLAHEIEVLLRQSTAQRQNILRAAFAGELVPQDPNDEPASVLLARIRAQRAAQTPAKKPRGRKKKEIQDV